MATSRRPASILTVCVVSDDRATQISVEAMVRDLGYAVGSGPPRFPNGRFATTHAEIVLFDARFELSPRWSASSLLLPFAFAPLTPVQALMLQDETREPPVSLAGKAPAQALNQALSDAAARKKMLRLSMPPTVPRVTESARLLRQDDVVPRSQRRQRHASRYELVVIGISTGGPEALEAVVPRLSPALSVPVLIVQHMPAAFTFPLAMKLSGLSPLPVAEAQQGEKLVPGRVLIAPGGSHLEVLQLHGSRVASLSEKPPVNGCRPSVDMLLESIAATGRGSSTLVCMMTGMGADGLSGCRRIHAQGGSVLTQSKETCTVYGMPRVIQEAGLAMESVDLSDVAARINDLLEDC